MYVELRLSKINRVVATISEDEKFTKHITRHLEPLGFVRHNKTWNRRLGSFIDVIQLDSGKFGDSVTLDVGVVHPEAYQKCWQRDLPAVLQATECTVRERVGALIDGKDLWWQVSEEGVANAVVATLDPYVLPFLDSMHSAEAMEHYLVKTNVVKKYYPPPIIYLAVLMHKRGDTTAACKLLRERGDASSSAWKSRYVEIAEALGCPT